MSSSRQPYPRRRGRRGSTVVLTMIFLCLFATLAIAFTASSNMNLRQAHNYSSAQSAQMAAESGMAILVQTVSELSITQQEAEEDLLVAVANGLAERMNGTANLGAGEVTFDGVTIRIPSIPLDASGQTFQAELTDNGDGGIDIRIRGQWGEAVRGVQMAAQPALAPSPIFDYGIASRSKIVMNGNADVLGLNDPSEASILSATYSDAEAVKLGGSCTIDGDVSTANPDSHVTITGNPSVGGETSAAGIAENIHIGVGNVIFPEVDPAVFEPFATNVVDASTPVSGNKSFENIRIKANTNPTFSGNITIKGVVFIEYPNVVKFTGNLNFTGVIATEDAGEDVFDDNFIQFTGNMYSTGVEELPEESQFTELREMPGSMLLAPGFGVKFTGNFSTVNGAIAADKFTFTGNAGGTVCGPVICYSDSDFTLTGNSSLEIDRSRYDHMPPGFSTTYKLVLVASSYREF